MSALIRLAASLLLVALVVHSRSVKPSRNNADDDIVDIPLEERPTRPTVISERRPEASYSRRYSIERNLTYSSRTEPEDNDEKRIRDDLDRDTYLWNKEEYPNPVLQPRFCRQMNPSSVCDPDDVLTKRQSKNLDKLIHKIGSELECVCAECPAGKHGLSIGVALMNNFYKPYAVHPTEVSKEYAEHLRRKWRLGACDNDVVILVSVNDRQYYAARGPTAQLIMTGEEATEIFEGSRRYFTDGDFYEGLYQMLEGYEKTLTDIQNRKYRTTETYVYFEEEPAEEESNLAMILGITFGVLMLLVLIALACWLSYRSWRARPENRGDATKLVDWDSVWATMTWRKQRTAPTSESSPEKTASYDPVATSVLKTEGGVQRAAPAVEEDNELSEDESEDEVTKIAGEITATELSSSSTRFPSNPLVTTSITTATSTTSHYSTVVSNRPVGALETNIE